MSFRVKVLLPIVATMVLVSVLLTVGITNASEEWKREEEAHLREWSERQRTRVREDLEGFVEKFVRSWSENSALSRPEALTTIAEDLKRFHERGLITQGVIFDRAGAVDLRWPAAPDAPRAARPDERVRLEAVLARDDPQFDGLTVYLPFRVVEAPQRATITGRHPPETARGSPPELTGSWSPRAPRLSFCQYLHYVEQLPVPDRPGEFTDLHFDELLLRFDGPTNTPALAREGESLEAALSRFLVPPAGFRWGPVSRLSWTEAAGRDLLRVSFPPDSWPERPEEPDAWGYRRVPPGLTVRLDPSGGGRGPALADPAGRFGAEAEVAVLVTGQPGRLALRAPELRSVRLFDRLLRPGLQAGDRAVFEFSRPTNRLDLAFLGEDALTAALARLFPVRHADSGEPRSWPEVAEALWINDGSYLDVTFTGSSPGLHPLVQPGDVITQLGQGARADQRLLDAGPDPQHPDPRYPAFLSWPGNVVVGGYGLPERNAPQIVEARLLDVTGTDGPAPGDQVLIEFDRPTNTLDLARNPVAPPAPRPEVLAQNLDHVLHPAPPFSWRGVERALWITPTALLIELGPDLAGARLPAPGTALTVASDEAAPITRIIRLDMNISPPGFDPAEVAAGRDRPGTQARVATIRTMIWLVVGAGAFVLVAVVSLLLTGLVLRPLEGLMRASARIAQGDYSHPVPPVERQDEIGQLITTFRHMMAEVRAFQQDLEGKVEAATRTIEATQRRLVTAQRLVSMGTLASGIAHEINNPLGGMLNAVRKLRRDAARAAKGQGARGKGQGEETPPAEQPPPLPLGEGRGEGPAPPPLGAAESTPPPPLGGRVGVGGVAQPPSAGYGAAAAERAQVYLELVEDGLVRIQETVARILQFSPRRPRDPARLGEVDLREVVQRTLALKAHDLETRAVRVDTRFCAPLPGVRGNDTELQQVLLNLLINALDAIPPGAPDGRLEVRIEDEGAHLALVVADNGVGMSEEQVAQAFDMFYTTKEQGKGTGLGLFIVHHVVTTAGGEVRIDSAPGRGTTVVCTVPKAGGAGAG